LFSNREHFHIAGPLPVVVAHEASLTQCLSNLLSNAIKFVTPGTTPQVKIRSEDAGLEVRLWIEDNGIGIAPEEHERVFGIFERGASASAYEGTGIGLAIARKGVERMNGRLGLESAAGQGSRFWIQLKKAPES